MHMLVRSITYVVVAIAIVMVLASRLNVQEFLHDAPHDMYDDAVRPCTRIPFDPQMVFTSSTCSEIS